MDPGGTSRKSVPKNSDPWRLFKGDDLTYPVEMFLHIMEFKNSQPKEASAEVEVEEGDPITRSVISHIPDPKYPAGKAGKAAKEAGADPPAALNPPSAMWKFRATTEGLDTQEWSTVRANLLQEFGQGTKAYTLKEKLALLQSIGKGAYEDSQAYLVRIRCVVSLLAFNVIPTGSLEELPTVDDVWVRVLFLFGLDDIEQNLLVEEADAKTLEELCQVLALPEVKMIRRADDAMQKEGNQGPPLTQGPEETGRGKRKRSSKNYAKMAAGKELNEGAKPPAAKRSKAVPKKELTEEDIAAATLQTEFKMEEVGVGVQNLQATDEADPAFIGADDSFADATGAELEEEEVDDDIAMVDDDIIDWADEEDVKPQKKGRKTKAGEAAKKKTSWHCVFCSGATPPFATNAALRKHQDEVHEGYHDKCDQCDLKFFKVADLQAHNNKFHADKKEKNKKYKKYVYDQISAQIEEAQRDDTDPSLFRIPSAKIYLPEPVTVNSPRGHKHDYKRKCIWKCFVCEQTFVNMKNYGEHCKEVHDNKIYKCHLCAYAGAQSIFLVGHLWRHHKVKCNQGPDFERFRCKYEGCEFMERDRWSVYKHIKTKHLERPDHPIDPSMPRASEDYQTATGKVRKRPSSNLHCEICNVSFNRLKFLANHMINKHQKGEEHAAVAVYTMDLENKKSKDDFKEAVNTKMKNSVGLQCDHCGWVTKKRDLMNRHMAANHPEDTSYDPHALGKGEFHCKICDVVLTGYANWHAHRSRHLETNAFQCGDCGKLFKTRVPLELHQAHKHNAANQKCPVCPQPDLQLYTITGVREHIRSYHWDSDKVCPVSDCQKVFRQVAEVISHFRYRHMNYLQIRCKLCGKKYDDKDTCKYHILWVHEKKKKMTELDPLFFDNTQLMEDYSQTDPHYPTYAIVQAEIDKVRLELKKERGNFIVTYHEIPTLNKPSNKRQTTKMETF